MRCLVMTAPQKIEIQEREMPVPKPGEALLRVLYGGICGSDISLYRGTMGDYASYPRIPGHEVAAEIVDVPETDLGLRPGATVTLNPYFNCGKCYSCRRGYINCCVNNQTMGLPRDGGFAEYITIPAERLYDGHGLDARLLAMVEPFCIGYHSAKRAEIRPGETVLVVGAGMIGLSAMLAAKAMGGHVVVSNHTPGKLDLARKLGADETILDDGSVPFREMVHKLTGGDGFDVLIEAAGRPFAIQQCVEVSAHRGRIIEVGITNTPMEFLFNQVEKKELDIRGSRNALPEDFLETIQLMRSGQLSLRPLLTDIISLDSAPEKFAALCDNHSNNVKTLIEF